MNKMTQIFQMKHSKTSYWNDNIGHADSKDTCVLYILFSTAFIAAFQSNLQVLSLITIISFLNNPLKGISMCDWKILTLSRILTISSVCLLCNTLCVLTGEHIYWSFLLPLWVLVNSQSKVDNGSQKPLKTSKKLLKTCSPKIKIWYWQ